MLRRGTTIGLAALCLIGPLAASSTEPSASRLAAELRRLYREPGGPGERWGHRPYEVTLADGTRAPRDAAYRDRPEFVAAAEALLASTSGDDASLGAWLLSTLPEPRAAAAEGVLIEALRHPDKRAAFEAARALGRRGSSGCLPALERAAQREDSAEVRAAAAWARAAVAGRHREPVSAAPRPGPLPASFLRGVSWWVSEGRRDAGAGSFQELAALGVRWVSIHTWEPRQRSLDAPDFLPGNGRFGIRDLPALVRNAHKAGLKVLYKPHLEMRGFDASPEEEAVFRRGDAATRRILFERVRKEGRLLGGRHNEIEMRTEADWRAWFANYADYILAHARLAQEAGADMLSVGRELDRTVARREADWRVLIGRIRALYSGRLTYAANFDSYRDLGFWDALDAIGISAYFALCDTPDPTPEDLSRGWDRALRPLEELSRRYGKPVLMAEVGYPAVPGAAAAPWRETRGEADVWLQARLYEAAFAAMAKRPWIQGAFPWLWEGTAQPPFRDPSYSIQGKPAAFVLARWYGGGGGGS
ncbi:MAG TPA: HEAT repeat domain-containing protein [Vicinamibacteria bacterium]|nr:HEAT repeat domain-containing protein [Vicinamibacteria bacterium]